MSSRFYYTIKLGFGMYGWDVLYLHDFPQITGQSRHNSNCLGSVQNHRVVFAAQ